MRYGLSLNDEGVFQVRLTIQDVTNKLIERKNSMCTIM